MKQLACMNRLILMFAFAGLASAQSPADETAAVSARVASYVDAFNRRDADACAEHWSKTAEYVFRVPKNEFKAAQPFAKLSMAY